MNPAAFLSRLLLVLALAAVSVRSQTVELVSQFNPQPPDTDVLETSVSADGRYVAYVVDQDGWRQTYLRDRTTSTTTLLSTWPGGMPAGETSREPVISADGSYLVFQSHAFLLPGAAPSSIYGYDTATGQLEVASLDASGNVLGGSSFSPAISADGRYVAFSTNVSVVAADTNSDDDIYVRDRQTNTVELISVAQSGAAGNGDSRRPQISDCGRYVAFKSFSTDLVLGDVSVERDVFVRDRTSGTTVLAQFDENGVQIDGNVADFSLSGDGRFVGFVHQAAGAATTYLRDLNASTTEIINVGAATMYPDPDRSVDVSPDGRFVVFHDAAATLVSGDTNGTEDVFLRDRLLNTTRRVSMTSNGGEPNDASYDGRISNDLRHVVFRSKATNISTGAPGSPNTRIWVVSLCENAVSAVAHASSTAVCVNQSATLSVQAMGGLAPYSYQWRLNAAPLSGQVSSTLSGVNQPGTYDVVVTDDYGCTTVSNALAITNLGSTTAASSDLGPPGCANGVVTLAAQNAPVVNSAGMLSLTVSGHSNVPFVVFASAPLAAPRVLSGTGCILYIDSGSTGSSRVEVGSGFVNMFGDGTVGFPSIPPNFHGVTISLQATVTAPGGPLGGIYLSNGISLTFGCP